MKTHSMNSSSHIKARLLLVGLFISPVVPAGLALSLASGHRYPLLDLLVAPYFCLSGGSATGIIVGIHIVLFCAGLVLWPNQWGKALAIWCIVLLWLATCMSLLVMLAIAGSSHFGS